VADLPKDRDRAVEDITLLQTVASLNASNQLFYLHPSFGYYFEVMYPEPHGLVYRLGPCPPNMLITPLLSKEVIRENEAFWERTDGQVLKPLLAAVGPQKARRDPSTTGPLSKLTYLKTEPNQDATVLAGYYSRALDSWGVALQRNGELEKAGAYFQLAQHLNADNVVAMVNLECNRNLRAGRKTFVAVSKSIEDEFGKYRNWDQVMGQNGPFDEPRFCYEEGRTMVKNSLYRQAAYQFDRVIALAPNNLPARLWLAQLYVLSQMPDQALKVIEQIHAQPELLPVPRTNQTELLSVETAAHLVRNDVAGAEATVQKALARYPGDDDLLAAATQVYLNHGRYSNALVLINKELKRNPENLSALITKGYACLQIGAYEDAIPALSRVLDLETNTSDVHYSALLNRAIAYLRSDKLDEAQHDYEVLQKAFPTAFRVYFGLQELAYRKKDTNACVRYSELYLANSPTNTEEFKFVGERLKELKPGAR
jgi:tetratricopeptide (TPR) repeat protein